MARLSNEIEKLLNQYESALRSKSTTKSEATIERNIKELSAVLRKKEKQFGGLDNFRQAVIEAIATDDREKLKELVSEQELSYLVTNFDVSQDDFVAREGFSKFLQDILKKDPYQIMIFDRQYILDNAIGCIRMGKNGKSYDAEASKRAQDMVIMRYGLDNSDPQTFENIGIAFGYNGRSSITIMSQRMQKFIRKLSYPKGALHYIKATIPHPEARERFIREFFEHHDIFYFADSERLNEDVKKELMGIYEDGIEKSKQETARIEQAKQDAMYISVIEPIKQANVGKSIRLSDGIDVLNFDVRVYNVLRRSGVNTIEELLAKTDDEITKMRNLGRKNADEVIAKKHSLKRYFDERGDLAVDSAEEIQDATDEVQQFVDTEGVFKSGIISVSLQSDALDTIKFTPYIEGRLRGYSKPIYLDEGKVFTIEEFINMDDDEIYRVRNLGKKYGAETIELRDKLREIFKNRTPDDIIEISAETQPIGDEIAGEIADDTESKSEEPLTQEELMQIILKQQEIIARQNKMIEELKRERENKEQ